jgi:hypothetical protein
MVEKREKHQCLVNTGKFLTICLLFFRLFPDGNQETAMSFTADSKESATPMISHFSPNGKSLDPNGHQASAHPLLPKSSSSVTVAMQVPICFGRRLSKSLQCVWQVIKSFSKSGGGARVWLELGTWVHPEAQHLVIDLNVWILTQMSEENFHFYGAQMHELVCQIRDNLRQDSIAVEVDGCLKFF